jgi:hypothetical protein
MIKMSFKELGQKIKEIQIIIHKILVEISIHTIIFIQKDYYRKIVLINMKAIFILTLLSLEWAQFKRLYQINP